MHSSVVFMQEITADEHSWTKSHLRHKLCLRWISTNWKLSSSSVWTNLSTYFWCHVKFSVSLVTHRSLYPSPCSGEDKEADPDQVPDASSELGSSETKSDQRDRVQRHWWWGHPAGKDIHTDRWVKGRQETRIQKSVNVYILFTSSLSINPTIRLFDAPHAASLHYTSVISYLWISPKVAKELRSD